MRKQYIHSSNSSPTMVLAAPWLLCLTVRVYDLPNWIYGVAGTLAVLSIATYVYRIASEDGVDVVKRGEQ